MERLILFTRNGESHMTREKSCLRPRWLIAKNHSSTKRKDCCWNYLLKRILYKPILSFWISFLFNVRYYFPAFRCFCASCVEWRFHVEISIANSSIYNQRNSLSTDLQTSILVLCKVYFLIYVIPRFRGILQCICELRRYGNGSVKNWPQGRESFAFVRKIWKTVHSSLFARMDMRIWTYLQKARVVFANVKYFRDSFHSRHQSLGSTQGSGKLFVVRTWVVGFL